MIKTIKTNLNKHSTGPTGLLQLFDGLVVLVCGLSILARLEAVISSLFQLGPGLGLLFLRHLFCFYSDRGREIEVKPSTANRAPKDPEIHR